MFDACFLGVTALKIFKYTMLYLMTDKFRMKNAAVSAAV
jgi:hypothetical protein